MNDKVAQIQTILGVTPDGLWGSKSRAALDALLSTPVGDLVDERSEGNIATLHPRLQPIARQLIQQAVAIGMPFKITSGTRTYEEQDMLYEQGRGLRGEIVTNARGGFSSHNFGLAFDVTLFENNRPVYESPLYAKLAKMGKTLGLAWGGDWKQPVDEPHLYLVPPAMGTWSQGAMLSELRRRHDNNIDPFV